MRSPQFCVIRFTSALLLIGLQPFVRLVFCPDKIKFKKKNQSDTSKRSGLNNSKTENEMLFKQQTNTYKSAFIQEHQHLGIQETNIRPKKYSVCFRSL